MSQNEVTTNEIMEFLQENVVTKEDLKREFGQLEHKLIDAMDQKMLILRPIL